MGVTRTSNSGVERERVVHMDCRVVGTLVQADKRVPVGKHVRAVGIPGGM